MSLDNGELMPHLHRSGHRPNAPQSDSPTVDWRSVHSAQEPQGDLRADQDAVKKPSLDCLTTLRFFAALAIVVYHLKPVMGAFFQPARGAYLYDRLSAGVGFFFILSGFVLYYNYGIRRDLDLKDFYVKRWVRIYPLHLLTLAVWCAFFLSGWGVSRHDMLLSGLANLTLTQAFFPGFLFSLGFNAVSWSLSNEAFFYALFPVVRRTTACILALALVASYIVGSHLFGFQEAVASWFPNIEYFFPPLRLAEFCAGVLIAKLYSTTTKLPHATTVEASVLAVALFHFCFQNVGHYSLNQLSYLPVFAALIWVFAHQQGAISRFLSQRKTLVLLGEASFSLYMWHHMIMALCNRWLPPTLPWWLAVSIAVTASICVSIASFKWFEDPARKVLTNLLLGAKPVVARAAASAISTAGPPANGPIPAPQFLAFGRASTRGAAGAPDPLRTDAPTS